MKLFYSNRIGGCYSKRYHEIDEITHNKSITLRIFISTSYRITDGKTFKYSSRLTSCLDIINVNKQQKLLFLNQTQCDGFR